MRRLLYDLGVCIGATYFFLCGIAMVVGGLFFQGKELIATFDGWDVVYGVPVLMAAHRAVSATKARNAK